MKDDPLQQTISELLEGAIVPEALDQQLQAQRRTVDFDTFDIQLQQLLTMLKEGQIWVAPAYQRQFRWKQKQCSGLIESLFLGIPVPSLFMATNADNTWEVVDGVQRLSSVVKFAGDNALREKLKVGDPLVLGELTKLTSFVGLSFYNLPTHLQRHFLTRPFKVITLNDKSDKSVRYDLFERVNTGGVKLTEQEIRDCVYQGVFADWLGELAKNRDFRRVLKLTEQQQRDGTAEECVLRFFAYHDRYRKFVHSVKDFLDAYMKDASEDPNLDFPKKQQVFERTFKELGAAFPEGLSRSNRRGTTPLNLYEGIAVGAAQALQQREYLDTAGIKAWMASTELRKFTTGATNRKSAVEGRIHFCRDRFLGKPYVESAEG